MGCGDSKLAVATSNTILRHKKSNAGDSTKKSNDIGTITDVTPHEQEAATSNGEQVAVNKENSDVVVAEDVKDIKENGDEKELTDNGDNKVLLLPEHEAGRWISEDSPKNFFSSRKLEEEGIDALISEGRSGTSDYYTPRHGAGSKGNVNFKADEESGNALELDHEDKELLPADEETKPAETTTEKEGEPAAILAGEPAVVLVEEKLVQEPAEVEITTTIVEAKISTPTAEQEKMEDEK